MTEQSDTTNRQSSIVNRQFGSGFAGLGDSDFVENVLKSAQEELEKKYYLKASGYDFFRIVRRVAEVMAMEIDQVTAFGKSPQTVKARSLLCFWLSRVTRQYPPVIEPPTFLDPGP